jgi:hypothetical protein
VSIKQEKLQKDPREEQINNQWYKFQNDYSNILQDKVDGKLSPESKRGQIADKLIENTKRFAPLDIGYDSYDNRVVLPYTSKSGKILAFTKRRLNEQDLPKWKHSSSANSLIAECGDIFNLQASGEIRKSGEIILAEGPGSAIAFMKPEVNMKNVIGVCGTHNVHKIWEYILPVPNITFAFDGDESGSRGIANGLLELSKLGFDLRHVFSINMPDGMDPWDVYSRSSQELIDLYSVKTSAIYRVAKFDKAHSYLSDIYNAFPEYQKAFFIKEVSIAKSMSINAAISWIQSPVLDEEEKKIDPTEEINISEKYYCICITTGKEIPDTDKHGRKIVIPQRLLSIKPDKAIKILRLRYGISQTGSN